jgi:hypothetical protein
VIRLRNQEAPVSNFGLEAGYPDWGFSYHLRSDRFLPCLFQFTATNHTIILRYVGQHTLFTVSQIGRYSYTSVFGFRNTQLVAYSLISYEIQAWYPRNTKQEWNPLEDLIHDSPASEYDLLGMRLHVYQAGSDSYFCSGLLKNRRSSHDFCNLNRSVIECNLLHFTEHYL